MPWFQVVADRSTIYEVEADDGEEAIDRMMAGDAREVDGTTFRIDAKEICPTCREELDDNGNCKDGHEVPGRARSET